MSEKYNINTNPLYFVRSGNVVIANGRSGYIGNSGYNWPSTASSKRYDDVAAPSAYSLNFGAIGIGSSAGPYGRWYGFPLRSLNSPLSS